MRKSISEVRACCNRTLLIASTFSQSAAECAEAAIGAQEMARTAILQTERFAPDLQPTVRADGDRRFPGGHDSSVQLLGHTDHVRNIIVQYLRDRC